MRFGGETRRVAADTVPGAVSQHPITRSATAHFLLKWSHRASTFACMDPWKASPVARYFMDHANVQWHTSWPCHTPIRHAPARCCQSHTCTHRQGRTLTFACRQPCGQLLALRLSLLLCLLLQVLHLGQDLRAYRCRVRMCQCKERGPINNKAAKYNCFCLKSVMHRPGPVQDPV